MAKRWPWQKGALENCHGAHGIFVCTPAKGFPWGPGPGPGPWPRGCRAGRNRDRAAPVTISGARGRALRYMYVRICMYMYMYICIYSYIPIAPWVYVNGYKAITKPLQSHYNAIPTPLESEICLVQSHYKAITTPLESEISHYKAITKPLQRHYNAIRIRN